MLDYLGTEYVAFLRENNLLQPLINIIQPQAAKSTNGLLSENIMEHVIDVVNEELD